MDKYNPKYMDVEEKSLMQDIEKMDVHKLSRPAKKTQKQFQQAAKRYLEKESKMNIRIDQSELTKIKERAEREGLKYQTLIKSVLHKYITGQLIEKGKRVI
jgi:predicted DNA binding CopG/RHH family protein